MSGIIKPDVQFFLHDHSKDTNIIKVFTQCFSINKAKQVEHFGSIGNVYYVKPNPIIADNFGFHPDQEILLFISQETKLLPRMITCINHLMNTEGASGRFATNVMFLVSNSREIQNWLTSNTSPQDVRIIVSFYEDEVRENIDNHWFIKNKLTQYLYGLDLFDFSLPIKGNNYFFGRQLTVSNIITSIRQGENKGIFGLRKTGKTSTLFHVKEQLAHNDKVSLHYYDCKTPHIRKLRWFELLGKIYHDINADGKVPGKLVFDEQRASESFSKFFNRLNSRFPERKIAIFIDEIEYISPFAKQDLHWKQDFLDFWQTMWSVQSEKHNLSFVICGVSPMVVQETLFGGVQNPLFGVVPTIFLTGFEKIELKEMINTLGGPMGLKFEDGAIDLIHSNFGGHPLLSRRVCSYLNQILIVKGTSKPFKITESIVEDYLGELNEELTFYCEHVVNEIREFYQDEYDMLEMLATGQKYEFIQFSKSNEYIKQLINLGVLKRNSIGIAEITIPALTKYIGGISAKKENRRLVHGIIEKRRRNDWFTQRMGTIISDFKFLERSIKESKMHPLLFGFNSFPNGDELKELTVVNSHEEFLRFINCLNKSFVESIENYGKFMSEPHYLKEVISNAYPNLYRILRVIKVLRHNEMHLVLTDGKVVKDVKQILDEYFEGNIISQIDDPYFVLQQRILDDLLYSLQLEISVVCY